MRRTLVFLFAVFSLALARAQVTCVSLPDTARALIMFTCSEVPVIDAEYSISDTSKVRFTSGNLMYQPSTNTWRIAPRQFDIVGGNSTQEPKGLHGTIWETIGGVRTRCRNDFSTDNSVRANYEGWIDLFPWGASGWYGDGTTAGEVSRTASFNDRKTNNPGKKVTANPWECSSGAYFKLNDNGAQNLTGDFANADWGTHNSTMLCGCDTLLFRAPTQQEAKYILSDRPNAQKLHARCQIKLPGTGNAPDTTINGLIILPDNWLETHGDVPFKSDSAGGGWTYYADNKFTLAQWTEMEAWGAIFLPAAGMMDNNNKLLKPNRSGAYWSSSSIGSSTEKSFNLQFGGFDASGALSSKSEYRYYGRAVRLMVEVRPAVTPPTPPTPSVTCKDFKRSDSSTKNCSILATHSQDSCEWTLIPQPAPGYRFAEWKNILGGTLFRDTITRIINTSQANMAMLAEFVRDNAYLDEWSVDSGYVRSKSDDIFSGSGDGYMEVVIDGSVLQDATFDVKSIDHGLWRFDARAILQNNTYSGQKLRVILRDACGRLTAVLDTIVPLSVTGNMNASDFASFPSGLTVHVFDGAVLTVDANRTIPGILEIHQGGKVIIPEGKTLTVDKLIMRGDAIHRKWPQLVVNGSLINNNNDTIYYDYQLDYRAYYPLALPYNVSCADIKNRLTGGPASFEVHQYNTATRASGASGWEVYDDTQTGATLQAGKGYSIFAVPSKWNGKRQIRASVRFPMKQDLSSGEAQKAVNVVSSSPVDAKTYNKNWNLIGNPYLADFQVNETNTNNLVAGYYEWSEEEHEYVLNPAGNVRYVTYSNDGFQTYEQERITDVAMNAFNCYFIQTTAGDAVTFVIDDRAQAAPRRQMISRGIEDELEVGITLTQGEQYDHAGILYGDYSSEYELNADLLKQFGGSAQMSVYSIGAGQSLAYQAVSYETLGAAIPLGYKNANISPTTFAFDDQRYRRDGLAAVWLTDTKENKVVNLLYEDYTFTPETEQNDSRFYLSIEKQNNNPTAVDNITPVGPVRVFDMLGREVTNSILHRGVYVMLDANGNSWKEVIQ